MFATAVLLKHLITTFITIEKFAATRDATLPPA
jgi:hypothetical protein